MGIWGKCMHVGSLLPATRLEAWGVNPPPEGYTKEKKKFEGT